jgi:hypothetical protein
MRIGAVDTIAADHDARNAASRPTVWCLMDAAGPGSRRGGAGETMNARDVKAAGRPALTRPGAAAGHPVTQQRQRRRRRFSSRAPGGARHAASAIAAALGRGCQQLTPALLGFG